MFTKMYYTYYIYVCVFFKQPIIVAPGDYDIVFVFNRIPSFNDKCFKFKMAHQMKR